MLKTFLIGAVAAGGVVWQTQGREFPLEFKTIPPKDVIQFPGGYGRSGIVRLGKSADLLKEPAAVSSRPIYGQLAGAGKKAMLLRLDESQGTGRGYDRLILDLNRNGDLTDDPVIGPEPAFTPQATKERERRLFGPISVPLEQAMGGARPVYFAELNLAARQNLAAASAGRTSLYLGSLRLKAGWYLEATVEVNGRTQKIGAYDGDASLSLGEPWQPQYYGQEKKQWYFTAGDSLLWDADGSGKFDYNQFGTESCPWGGLIWFDAVPSQVAFATDWKTVSIEPWQGELGELVVQPQGSQVRVLTLAWDQTPRDRRQLLNTLRGKNFPGAEQAPDGQWQLVKVRSTDGRFRVPAGNYRLYQDLLAADLGGGNQVSIGGNTRSVAATLKVQAGQPTVLRCGGPLEAKLAAEPDKYNRVESLPGGYVLYVQAEIVGQAGETCASFARGKGYGADDPSPPVFKVQDAKGKVLASGKMEFG